MCVITASAVGTALGVSAAAAAKIALAANIAIGVSVAAGVTGGVVGGISSVQQGKAQQAQYNYQAKVQEENAKIAQENANVERQQGIEEARLQRLKTASVIGSQKTAMAANGVDITQGTAVDVISDTAAMGELDALQTQYNYETKARAYEVESGNFKNQANLDRISGQNAYSAGKMNALTSTINGLGESAGNAGQLALKWFM
jgi:hypothetical protein